MNAISKFFLGVATALLAAVVLPHALLAGPPLICHPFSIGDAASLPWGNDAARGWENPKADYDLTRLVPDTLALLTGDTPVIVRMETMRRASIYAAKNREIAAELLEKLKARASEKTAKSPATALALFDAGYLAESYKQLDWMFKQGNPATGFDGYTIVVKAIEIRGGDPEMEFAAALITADGKNVAKHKAHLGKAVAGAKSGSMLAINLGTHFNRG